MSWILYLYPVFVVLGFLVSCGLAVAAYRKKILPKWVFVVAIGINALAVALSLTAIFVFQHT